MKNYSVETFMSWENEDLDGKFIRAIALCRPDGFFFAAINCVRDGDMGEKDENGVYPRIWWGDYIKCYGNERDIRPATPAEVDLYMQYCGYGYDDSDTSYRIAARVYDKNGTHLIIERRGWLARCLKVVSVELRRWWSKMIRKIW